MSDMDRVPSAAQESMFKPPADYLCKWCLAYVGQRRQFCSADCAAQFKLCQRRRDQKQAYGSTTDVDIDQTDLNISVDYYGNVKLSIQGSHLNSRDTPDTSRSVPYQVAGHSVPRRSRRPRRCRNCAKLLKEQSDDEFCDETCQSMDTDRNKKEDFVNIFQQKEIAERRRIRKWLLDAQDHYTKQQGDEPGVYNIDESDIVTSGPAALNPLPVVRTPIHNPEPLRRSKDIQSRIGGPSYPIKRTIYAPAPFRLRGDEIVTGGPVTLNPTPLRRGNLPPSNRRTMDNDRRHVMIDLKWIPKFYG